MALSRFVVGTTVTLPPGTGTGGNFGTESWAGASGPPIQWANGMAATFLANTVLYADGGTPAVPATPPQQLYAALQAAGANLRAYVQGQDDVGHASLSN